MSPIPIPISGFTGDVIAKFHQSYKINPDGCWEWTGAINKKTGYGHFRVAGKNRIASRVGYMIANRLEDPFPFDVLHRCDNPRCVRPDHLLKGDHLDNMRDMVAKGRQNHVRGENHPLAKLNTRKVELLRHLATTGFSLNEIAKVLGVSKKTVLNVKKGKIWKTNNSTHTIFSRKSTDKPARSKVQPF